MQIPNPIRNAQFVHRYKCYWTARHNGLSVFGLRNNGECRGGRSTVPSTDDQSVPLRLRYGTAGQTWWRNGDEYFRDYERNVRIPERKAAMRFFKNKDPVYAKFVPTPGAANVF
jgi:hypothetical protein